MANKRQEPTTKFKVDISELKAGITEANRQIRLANSEFKAAASSMDDWSTSADGVSAKLKQLDSVLQSENKKLDLLREQHRLVAAEQGENSKAAEELMIKIHNQEAAVNKVNSEIKKYNGILDDLASAADEAESDVQQLSDAVDDAANSAENAEGGFTVLKGAIADLVADGIRAAIGAFKELLTVSDRAMGSFQAQTGASAEEMEKFNEQINNLYKDNFGEDMRDVADSMALVAQNTKEVDPSKIRELTENAITLRDAFGFEVNETMRAANMLMDQFGITGDEAFALIAQGAQNGLDKNGDLLDSINEYSVHYKQLGLDAEGFFNSLQNGTEAGTFSVDKLGDAVKEFGIRVKDGSKGSAEAFDYLGYDADALFETFNKGGEDAAAMFEILIDELTDMPDSVEKTTAGVALFGTMWEDLGIEGIKALGNINGAADKTKATMNEIKEAKYSDIGSQFSEIGRMIQVDFIAPLAETALPLLKDGITWVKENLDTLVPVITGIGTAFMTAFAITQITSFIGTLGTLVTSVKSATTVAGALKAGMAALNITMSMNPIGLVIAAIAGLVAAFVLLWNKSDAFKKFWIDLWDKIKTYFFAAMNKVVEFFNNLPTTIYNILVSILGHILAWGVKLWNFATNDIPKFITKVIEWFGTLPDKIQTWLANALAKVIAWGANMVKNGGQYARDTVQSVIDAFFGLPDKLFEIGSNALTGFWDGLKSVGSKIKKWATDFFGSILKKAEEVLEIGSPSKAMKRIAAWTMEGFDNEAVAKGKKVIQNVRTTFENVKAAASEALGGMGSGSGSVSGIAGSTQKTVQNVTNFYQTNNSPKALSRYEVYRQSKNLLNRGRVYV